MNKSKFGIISSVCLAILLITLLVGCGVSRPAPEELIDNAITAIKEVQTYRVDGEHTSTENGETTQSSFQMEFVSPDKMYTITENEWGTEENIMIGLTLYSLSSDSDNWQVRQWPVKVYSYDLAASIVATLGSLVELVELPDERINGLSCYHYKGSIDMDAKVDKEIANLDTSQRGYEEVKRMLEQQRQWKFTVEFWIDKEDYLIQQLKQHNEMVMVEDIGEDTEREEYMDMVVTFVFFDFNEPIEIEPPMDDMVEGINLKASAVSNIGGEDLRHQRINYEITVSNKGIETAKGIRVFVDSPATNQGLQTMEAEPSHRPVDLGPGEHETYLISWEYDMENTTKQELVELHEGTVLRATWFDEEDQQYEKVLLSGR